MYKKFLLALIGFTLFTVLLSWTSLSTLQEN